MENTEMTIKDIIKMVAEDLGKLKIPMDELETIALPVRNAIKALNACTEAIERAEAQMKPEIEIIPVEEKTPEE